jgi:hypothetical protein
MNAALSVSEVPTRLATGAFLLNEGRSKRHYDHERVKHLHAMAAEAYPFLENVDPEAFTKALSAGEMAIGTVLLAPFVPGWVAGIGLTAFAGGLIGLYMRLPRMHEPGSVVPTEDGRAVAKDVWLASIGVSLVVGGIVDGLVSRLGRITHRRS